MVPLVVPLAVPLATPFVVPFASPFPLAIPFAIPFAVPFAVPLAKARRKRVFSSQYVALRLEMPNPVCCQNAFAVGNRSAG